MMTEKKKSRFILDEEDVVFIKPRKPTREDVNEADDVFDKILKKKRPK